MTTTAVACSCTWSPLDDSPPLADVVNRADGGAPCVLRAAAVAVAAQQRAEFAVSLGAPSPSAARVALACDAASVACFANGAPVASLVGRDCGGAAAPPALGDAARRRRSARPARAAGGRFEFDTVVDLHPQPLVCGRARAAPCPARATARTPQTSLRLKVPTGAMAGGDVLRVWRLDVAPCESPKAVRAPAKPRRA